MHLFIHSYLLRAPRPSARAEAFRANMRVGAVVVMDMVTRCIPSSSSSTSSASFVDFAATRVIQKDLACIIRPHYLYVSLKIDFENVKYEFFEKVAENSLSREDRPQSATHSHADDAARTARPTHALRRSVEKNLIPPIDVAHTAHRRSRASRTVD